MIVNVRFSTRRPRTAAIAALVCIASPAMAQQPPLIPDRAVLRPGPQTAIDAEWLTDQERKDLRVFHGVWDDRDIDSPTRRAAVALNAGDFDDPSLSDPSVPVELRAEALLKRGDLDDAIRLLAGARSMRAGRILAEAYEGLGAYDAALDALRDPVQRLLQADTDDPARITDGVRAIVVRARIEGRPARDYQTMMTMLGRAHQELDRLYWPAILAEALLLADKDNSREAIAALHDTLGLNPRSAAAWYALGRIALKRFDFSSAQLAADRLRRLSPAHPFADLLLAESRLVQDDPTGALDLLNPLVQRYPRMRDALALVAAAQAIRYDVDALEAALERYDELSPGSAVAYFKVGRHLSLNRQYAAAADALNEAIRRQPAWPAPQIELGLMELQSGRDERALAALESVTQLDPFNKRAINSLLLLRELAGYATVETEHFVIRYKPGIDEVMVELMAEPLERIHEIVAGRFRHEPDRRTIIELTPDHATFAVRITGMPWIHTIAASTGPVIALQVPREGPPSEHQGPFDWARVIQHEYTHTINLSQTRNRIPHWLTEAAAVSMELAPRDYATCQQLAMAYEAGELFDLDEIKWAFVRPKRPGDRSLAYAQAHWMVEYMNQRFGESALVRLLELYFEGVREREAMTRALGIPRDEFYQAFLEWAGEQLESWGLVPPAAMPTIQELEDTLRWVDPDLAASMTASQKARLAAISRTLADRIGRPAGPRSRRERKALTADLWPDLIRPPVEIDDTTLDQWMQEYPGHPDLLEMLVRREISSRGGPDETDIERLQAYARARPVDPYPHKKLAQIWRNSDSPQRAITHLEELDAREQKSPVFAYELARLYRSIGNIDTAMAKADRAVQISPYDADYREQAAALAIEAGRLDLARRHIRAMTLIEPGQTRHRRRLEAIDRLMEKGDRSIFRDGK